MAIAGYGGAVVLLALVLREVPMGLTYVIWTGAGTAGVVLTGAVIFGDVPSGSDWWGVALVIAGVVMINAGRGSSTTPTKSGF